MRPGNLSRFSKQLCLACLVLGGPRLAQGQRPVALPAAQHAPTCDAALREYKSVAQIGAPFDTLTMKLDPVKVTIDEFRSFMRARMAEIGATGYLTSETVIDADHSFTRFVPVFVPSDSARIRKDCTAARPPADRR